MRIQGVASVLIGVTLCSANGADEPKRRVRQPRLERLPSSVLAPADNPTTEAKVSLGRRLFFDARLSGSNRLSCGTCHQPRLAFTDRRARAVGANNRELARNTPTVINSAFYATLFWDGRVRSLEQQALAPIKSADEMDQDLDELERELGEDADYVIAFRKVFDSGITRRGIARALAAYQRTLVSGPSAFDRFLDGDEAALSLEALRGRELFVGEAGCIRCHHGPLLSDGKFYRLGVSFRDVGRQKVTQQPADRYKFRTPSLRNVALTPPYMHDGSLRTLDDVVMFYFREVPASTPSGQRLDIEPLQEQSFSDMAALVEFLRSLSGSLPAVEDLDQ